jgi:hypothetical protein
MRNADRLIKMLAMMTSDNEAEALTALRAVKAFAAEHNIDLRDLRLVGDKQSSKKTTLADIVEDAFTAPEELTQKNVASAKLVMTDYAELLTETEAAFIDGVISGRRQLNPKSVRERIEILLGHIAYIIELDEEKPHQKKRTKASKPMFTMY